MQSQIKNMALVAMCTISSPATINAQPLPSVQIYNFEMPQYISGFPMQVVKNQNTVQAIMLYHQLRDDFNLSNTTMGNWLGVKRRSLYNWLNEPESAKKYGEQIEYRLDALSKLSEDMEPEHRPLLSKIAFSPIYGDPKFGDSIIEGKSSHELLAYYDNLFPQFESYRRTLKRKLS